MLGKYSPVGPHPQPMLGKYSPAGPHPQPMLPSEYPNPRVWSVSSNQKHIGGEKGHFILDSCVTAHHLGMSGQELKAGT